MSKYLIEASGTLLIVCLLVRVADELLAPVLPLLVIAALLAGVAWLVLGRPGDLS